MDTDYFRTGIAQHIWDSKYRYRLNGEIMDHSITDSWRRVARALSTVEHKASHWEQHFYDILEDFRFLPGGRILAGAGTEHDVTLFNCFAMGLIDDSMEGIFHALREGALTMQQGGGVGYDFSTLRPAGTPARRVGSTASGPVSFMRIWDSMCATLLSTGNRRGAMMATLRCDHPDIEAFIDAKRTAGVLQHFNLSVQVSDDFIRAVDEDAEWPLLFPVRRRAATGEIIERHWPGEADPVPCQVYKRVSASALWQRIMRATYDVAEPGVLFIDRINRQNNLYYCEHISTTNPCGEIPLPPWGACNLGSINLTRFVRQPFSAAAEFDLAAVAAVVRTAVRLMDNVIDVSRFPLPQQADSARHSRRLGLGITGLADTLIMLNLRYGDDEALEFASTVMRTLRDSAYGVSVELAQEKGVFPAYEREPYLAGEYVQSLPAALRDAIAAHGIRNSHLVAIAPTGTISLLANNVSSSLEPVFARDQQRRILINSGEPQTFRLKDYAWRQWTRDHAGQATPPSFVEAADISPAAHLAMQAALQPFVDNAISKTINIPADFPFSEFTGLYRDAWSLGLKGITTYRPNAVTGAILEPAPPRHCCSIERESE